MSALAIEIHPSVLRALPAEPNASLIESPAALHVGPGAVSTGELALRRARLDPAGFRDHFWDALSRDPLAPALRGFGSSADLAYAHLAAFVSEFADHDGHGGAPASVRLAVSSHLDRGSLSLLLGLVEAVGYSVEGLVDAAVAAGSHALLESGKHAEPRAKLCAKKWWVLDAGPHQAWATPLEVNPEATAVYRAGDVVPLGEGHRALRDAWLARLAERFVEESRFDPLHHAEGEQALFDLLPACALRLLPTDASPVAVRIGESEHRAQLRRSDLVEASHAVFAGWREVFQQRGVGQAGETDSAVLLSSGLAQVPGVQELLAGTSESELRVLPEEAALRGLLAFSPRPSPIVGDALQLLQRLGEPAAGAVSGSVVRPPEPPTHLLVGDRAQPLTSGELRLCAGRGGLEFCRGRIASAAKLTDSSQPLARVRCAQGGAELVLEGQARAFCNRQPVEGGVRLRLGDRLSFEAVQGEGVLIHVGDPGGA